MHTFRTYLEEMQTKYPRKHVRPGDLYCNESVYDTVWYSSRSSLIDDLLVGRINERTSDIMCPLDLAAFAVVEHLRSYRRHFLDKGTWYIDYHSRPYVETPEEMLVYVASWHSFIDETITAFERMLRVSPTDVLGGHGSKSAEVPMPTNDNDKD